MNILKEWGSKYRSETDAWEALKGMCRRSDIQLQDPLAEIHLELKAEFGDETIKEEPEIADEKDSETVPLMSKSGHGIRENKEMRGKTVQEEKQAIIQGSQSSEGTRAAELIW